MAAAPTRDAGWWEPLNRILAFNFSELRVSNYFHTDTVRSFGLSFKHATAACHCLTCTVRGEWPLFLREYKLILSGRSENVTVEIRGHCGGFLLQAASRKQQNGESRAIIYVFAHSGDDSLENL
jgi:hypothetical protein